MTRILFTSAALIAVAAIQIAPAAAQGVPAGLLRLDPPSSTLNAQASLDQPKVRNSYAHVRKHHVAQ